MSSLGALCSCLQPGYLCACANSGDSEFERIDFDSDVPLVFNRDQEGDETCESCQ